MTASSKQLTESFWQTDYILQNNPRLQGSLFTDVCIIGGGVVGLMTGLALLKQGHKVVILERGSLERNETGFTSAHLSDALDDGFARLLEMHGIENLRNFYSSHHQALHMIERLIIDENIPCGFARVPGYLFLAENKDAAFLENELVVAHQAGAVSAYKVEEVDHGFIKLGASLCFPNQAQFHPLEFIAGLVTAIKKRGGHIYEHTNASEFHDGDTPTVKTDGGFQVRCKDIILATNGPTTANQLYFKQAAFRTYVLALRVEKNSLAPALYWDTADSYHYLRVHASPELDHDVLLVGGEDHRVGEGHPEQAFGNLVQWIQKNLQLPRIDILSSWSGQIMEPVDGIAFIGRSPGEEHIYLVTGDSGHGFTHAAIAAEILPALIKDKKHHLESLFAPTRMSWNVLSDYIEMNGNTAMHYADWFANNSAVEALTPNEGCVIQKGLHKLAVHKDAEGKVSYRSAVCPHLGGIVRWNPLEKTWDCPCHGSRFATDGSSLHAPATKDLEPNG